MCFEGRLEGIKVKSVSRLPTFQLFDPPHHAPIFALIALVAHHRRRRNWQAAGLVSRNRLRDFNRRRVGDGNDWADGIWIALAALPTRHAG